MDFKYNTIFSCYALYFCETIFCTGEKVVVGVLTQAASKKVILSTDGSYGHYTIIALDCIKAKTSSINTIEKLPINTNILNNSENTYNTTKGITIETTKTIKEMYGPLFTTKKIIEDTSFPNNSKNSIPENNLDLDLEKAIVENLKISTICPNAKNCIFGALCKPKILGHLSSAYKEANVNTHCQNENRTKYIYTEKITPTQNPLKQTQYGLLKNTDNVISEEIINDKTNLVDLSNNLENEILQSVIDFLNKLNGKV